MSARLALGHIRHVLRPCVQNRHASTVQSPMVRRLNRQKTLGQQIYVFNHIQTNQVVFSLTKALKNNAALKQIPFNGKKTVPAALRKDVWSPMATISFVPGAESVGLAAFQRLREYKRLHELSWDDSLMTDEKGKVIPRKVRGRQISNQKANVIADMSAVLSKIGTEAGQVIGIYTDKASGVSDVENVTKVEVKWTNMLDAEFAETWGDNVVHDKLNWVKNNRERYPRDAERDADKDWSAEKDELSLEEMARKQQAYWAKLDQERAKWYVTNGKTLSEMPPRKLPPPKSRKGETLSVQEILEQERRRVEKERKQIEYWAKLDKKRQEYWLSQGKSLEDLPPRKNVVHETRSTRDQEKALVRSISILESRKYNQEKRLDQMIAEAKAELGAEQYGEFWAKAEERRQKWYLSQGKSLNDIPPRKDLPKLNKTTAKTLLRFKKRKLALQRARDQEIAFLTKLIENDPLARQFWNSTLSPEAMAEIAEQTGEEKDGIFWTEVANKANAWYATQERWTPTVNEVATKKLLQEEGEWIEANTVTMRAPGTRRPDKLAPKEYAARQAQIALSQRPRKFNAPRKRPHRSTLAEQNVTKREIRQQKRRAEYDAKKAEDAKVTA